MGSIRMNWESLQDRNIEQFLKKWLLIINNLVNVSQNEKNESD